MLKCTLSIQTQQSQQTLETCRPPLKLSHALGAEDAGQAQGSQQGIDKRSCHNRVDLRPSLACESGRPLIFEDAGVVRAAERHAGETPPTGEIDLVGNLVRV